MADQSKFEDVTLTKEEEETYKTILNVSGFNGLYEYAVSLCNSTKISLNVAVAGRSRKSKSNFINAFLSLKNEDKGAASSDPSNMNISEFDLKQLIQMHDKDKQIIGECDAFTIVSSKNFSKKDVCLAKEVRKIGTPVYFVRTNVDDDSRKEKEKEKKDRRTKDKIIKEILSDCLESLKKHGLPECFVYLIDNFPPYLYDIDLLTKTVIRNAQKKQREKPVRYAHQVLRERKNALEKRIQSLAFCSGAAGATPIPGFGLSVDIAIFAKEALFFRAQLGLTDDDIKDIAKTIGLKEEEIKRVLKNFLACCAYKGYTVATREIILAVPLGAAKLLIPVIGSICSGVLSYKSTKICLVTILENLFNASVEINEKTFVRLEETSQHESDLVLNQCDPICFKIWKSEAKVHNKKGEENGSHERKSEKTITSSIRKITRRFYILTEAL